MIINASHNELKANLKRTQNVFITYEQRPTNEHQRIHVQNVDMYFIKGHNLMGTAGDHSATKCPRTKY